MKQRNHTHRHHSDGFLLGTLTLAAFLMAGPAMVRLSASVENVCVTVTVIGEEDVELDPTPCEGIGYIPPTSSSSAASSASSTSSAGSSSGGTGGGTVSTSDGEGTVTDKRIGGQRGDDDSEMRRTRKLFRRWRADRLRSAADDQASSSAASYCGLPYDDVEPTNWFAAATRRFYCKGYLHFRDMFSAPTPATRADMAMILVKMSGWRHSGTFTQSGFDDVSPDEAYAPYVEEAARKGWMIGYGNCYGKTSPCYTRPERAVSRAEAAAMIVRFFSLKETGTAIHFNDVPENAWFFAPVHVAADHCLFRGDAGVATMRPNDLMNRAEMVTLLDRMENELQTGHICAEPETPESRGIPTKVILKTDTQPRPSFYSIHGEMLLGEGCDKPTLGCLTVSTLQDATDLLASLLSFPLPDGTSLKDASSGEPISWLLFVLGVIAGGAGCSVVVRRTCINTSSNR